MAWGEFERWDTAGPCPRAWSRADHTRLPSALRQDSRAGRASYSQQRWYWGRTKLCDGACPVHCRVLDRIPVCYPSPRWENQKHLQTLQMVSEGQNCTHPLLQG